MYYLLLADQSPATVDRVQAFIACHVLAVAGRPVAGDCRPCERDLSVADKAVAAEAGSRYRLVDVGTGL